jgi:hypothetical protein
MKINKSMVISTVIGAVVAAVAVYQIKKRLPGVVDD